MQLNEIIEENSIATISKRTRISVENIEKLVKRDFSDMKRVKALGFISILEREFSIELQMLKKECQEHFYASPEEEFDARLVVTIPESDDYDKGGWLSKLLLLLLLCMIGYASWYFLADRRSSSDTNTTISSTGFIGTIVTQAKAWLGDSSALDVTQTPAVTTDVWAKKETEENKTVMPDGSNVRGEDAEAKTDLEKNDSATEEQIIREVKQEQKEMLAQASEANDGDLFAADEQVLTDTNSDVLTVDNAPAVEQTEDALATSVPSMQENTKEETATSLEVLLPPELKTEPKKGTANELEKPLKDIQVVTLHPGKKVWVGYTDLKTMKRAAKVVEEDIDFDTSGTSWILVAGHSTINFVIKGEKITPKKRDKNYFLISEGKVKAISKVEFQKRNKSTVW